MNKNEIQEILSLYRLAKKTRRQQDERHKLPSEAYFLKDGVILVGQNPFGDARFPYAHDGLTLWAYASGYLTLNESNFFIISPTQEGKEPYFACYGGIKNKKDRYQVISITGVSDTEYGEKFEKYCIFTPAYALYLRKVNGLLFALKTTVNQKKQMIISTAVINQSAQTKDVYLSLYFNPLLMHSSFENEEMKWFRKSSLTADGCLLQSDEDITREIAFNHYALLKRATNGQTQATTSRMYYVGDKNQSLSKSQCLRRGEFAFRPQTSQFIDMACYGDLNAKTLAKGEFLFANFAIGFANSPEELSHLILQPNDNFYDYQTILERHYQILRHPKKSLQIAFKSLKTPQINDALFNAFIKSVIHQVNYCAEAKNSSLMLLGVRDAAQMYEASLLWHPQAVRTYIINLLNFLDPSGRMPRQISIPKKQTEVVMDNRAFIDQGQWIISLVYKYLVYTDDFTLLDEPCTYCELIGLNRGRMLAKTSSVYQHLEEIMAFLLANLDQETNCLHTLYGDWNDAVDGLGISRDPKKEFGNGVSAMATYHLYKNLFEFSQIAQAHKKEYQAYLKMRERVLQGIMTHLIVSQGEEKRLIHGWGENRSFYVGSFQDVDLKARHSATSNAFYVISGVYQRHPEMKPHLLKAFSALDSPYGIRTFDHYFDKKDAKAVGRIVNLPPGTAENAATYLHASMFATKALAMMNEGELMFAQLIKLLPLSHQTISTSPFVMPNSYGYNRELGIDGQSMNDWYTGSANTFIKLLVDDIFGLQPQIGSGLKINPLENFPSQSATISLMIKNHLVKMRYRQEGRGHRLIKVNGETITNNLIDLSEYPKHILIEVSD